MVLQQNRLSNATVEYEKGPRGQILPDLILIERKKLDENVRVEDN